MSSERKRGFVFGDKKKSNPDAKRSAFGVPSLLSAGLEVIGTVKSDGEIQLDGEVEGNIQCKSLVIGSTAVIRGDVMADNVEVRGHVIGQIRAVDVNLPETAHVEGDIIHKTMAVESGAFINGSCWHSEDPLATDESPPAAMAPPSRDPIGEHAAAPHPLPIKTESTPIKPRERDIEMVANSVPVTPDPKKPVANEVRSPFSLSRSLNRRNRPEDEVVGQPTRLNPRAPVISSKPEKAGS